MDTPTIQEVKSRIWIPILLTAVWFAFAGFVLYAKRDALLCLKLNEIGDALAGFFSPVAFLWLVSGYLQQGKELKLSSDALILQAQELSNSVHQQKQLVSVSRQELALTKSALENAQDREKDSLRPKFMLSYGGLENKGDGTMTLDYGILNVGHPVLNVTAKIYGSHTMQISKEFLASNHDAITFKITLQPGETITDLSAIVDYELINGDLERQVGKGIKIGTIFSCQTFIRAPRS